MLKAKPICKKNMWRIEVEFEDGTTLCLGRSVENIGFKFIEFNNKFEAINYIEKNKELELGE